MEKRAKSNPHSGTCTQNSPFAATSSHTRTRAQTARTPEPRGSNCPCPACTHGHNRPGSTRVPHVASQPHSTLDPCRGCTRPDSQARSREPHSESTAAPTSPPATGTPRGGRVAHADTWPPTVCSLARAAPKPFSVIAGPLDPTWMWRGLPPQTPLMARASSVQPLRQLHPMDKHTH